MESYLIIMGMAILTYVLRVIPFYFANYINNSEKIKNLLSNMPYAIFGAILFPASLYSVGNNFATSFMCVIAATFVSLYTENLGKTVLASLVVAIFLLHIRFTF